jgi:hypothetical protein
MNVRIRQGEFALPSGFEIGARKLSQLQDNLAIFDVSLKVNASEFSGFEEFEIKDSIVPPSGTTHSVACCKG